MAVKEAPDRAGGERDAVLATEQVGEFDQGDVHLRLEGSQDYVAIRLDVVERRSVSALLYRVPFVGSAPGVLRAGPRPCRKAAICARTTSTAAITRSRKSCDSARVMHAGLLSSRH